MLRVLKRNVSTRHMFWLRNMKINVQLCTLTYGHLFELDNEYFIALLMMAVENYPCKIVFLIAECKFKSKSHFVA